MLPKEFSDHLVEVQFKTSFCFTFWYIFLLKCRFTEWHMLQINRI